MKKIKTDFVVVERPKSFGVYGRRSCFENGEWHWIDGWHTANFKTKERADIQAKRLNDNFGGEFVIDE